MSKIYSVVVTGLIALTLFNGSVVIAASNSIDAKDPIIHLSPDANTRNTAVWAVTTAGRLLWCRSTGSDTECIAYQSPNTDVPTRFIELAERVGNGGSSVWALTKRGQLYWCRPEGMKSIACYP